MPLNFETNDGPVSVTLTRLTIAGWTGRDTAAVRHHIEELAALGVPEPSQTPLFYQVSPDLATQSPEIAVLGGETSGEAEPFVVRIGGQLFLGIGSDHTDRALEAHSVAHSKQICAKPLGRALWPFGQVGERIESLRLRCWAIDGGQRRLYQEGTLAQILPLEQLLDENPLADGEGMLCGTLPAIGGVKTAERFEMELRDGDGPVLTLGYDVRPLAVVQ